MNFLAPLFLLGAVLVGAPIVAHLIRRATRERVAFSATRFLTVSAPRLTRRSRLSHPWLLALRVLIVLLLAAGFARPWLESSAATPTVIARPPRHVAVVLDESASMQRRGLWPAAVERVQELAADLTPADQLVVLSTAGGATTLLSAAQWQQTPPAERAGLVARLLAERRPGWGTTPLDTTIDAAADLLAELAENTTGARASIVVVSDLTAGARLSGLAGREWPRGLTLELAGVDPATPTNAGLAWLGWVPQPGGERTARVRVSLHGSFVAQPFALQLATSEGTPLGAAITATPAADDPRTVLVPVPASATGPLRLTLTGDEEPFDNTLWLVPPQPRTITVRYVGEHAAEDPAHARFYLTRATEGWRDPHVRIAATAPLTGSPTSAAAGAPAASTSDTANALATPPTLVVLTAPLSAEAAAALRTELSAGTFALVLLTSPELVTTAAALAGETGWTPLAPFAPRGGALLGTIDFAHPLFAPFADPRFSDFTRVRFWRAQSLTLPSPTAAHVAARFDDGAPAVVEVPVGRGAVVVWGGDWSAVAGQWVLSSKFVPWLQSLLERSAGGPPRPTVAEIGDLARLGVEADATWTPAATTRAADPSISSPATPGLYQVTTARASQLIALNVPASETVTSPLPLDSWEKLGVPLTRSLGSSGLPATSPRADAASANNILPPATAARLEGEQQLWRWVLLAAAALLAVESLVAATTRARTPASDASPALPSTPSASPVS